MGSATRNMSIVGLSPQTMMKARSSSSHHCPDRMSSKCLQPAVARVLKRLHAGGFRKLSELASAGGKFRQDCSCRASAALKGSCGCPCSSLHPLGRVCTFEYHGSNVVPHSLGSQRLQPNLVIAALRKICTPFGATVPDDPPRSSCPQETPLPAVRAVRLAQIRKSRFLSVPKDIGYAPALDPRKSSRFRLDHPQDRLPP